jgi:xanthine dehydrogenase YagS FAD-binding subunit
VAAGELVTAVEIPACSFATNSTYRKVRDRASYAFALVSVAAALDVDAGGSVKDVRLALGGVAHKPWRAHDAEAVMRGAPATEATFATAADAELQDARGLHHNAFKIELAKRVIVACLLELAEAKSAGNKPDGQATSGNGRPDGAGREGL